MYDLNMEIKDWMYVLLYCLGGMIQNNQAFSTKSEKQRNRHQIDSLDLKDFTKTLTKNSKTMSRCDLLTLGDSHHIAVQYVFITSRCFATLLIEVNFSSSAPEVM